MKKLIFTLILVLTAVSAFAQWTPAINEYYYRADTVCFRGELINVPATNFLSKRLYFSIRL